MTKESDHCVNNQLPFNLIAEVGAAHSKLGLFVSNQSGNVDQNRYEQEN